MNPINALARYNVWLQHPYFDMSTRLELNEILGRPNEIDDRFGTNLEFGTGGLRGLIGAGTNRFNRYTVRQASQALATHIHSYGSTACERGVVIAYDSRMFSREFAEEAALTLAANSIPVYGWDDLRPTPLLSFAVRALNAQAGIVISASHNPPQYNGYKVYWDDGAQIGLERALAIGNRMREIDLTEVHPLPRDAAQQSGLLRPVPAQVDETYANLILGMLTSDRRWRSECRILYSPLHGTGTALVQTILRRAGFLVSAVREQERPDPAFPTVRTPNPEDPEVFTLALRQAAAEEADVILATDPDADRIGVMVRDSAGLFRYLTGNQLGAILLTYLAESRSFHGALPERATVLKTMATSNLAGAICREYGLLMQETHTGFKFIGQKIREFEQTGSHTFVFGFEESCGYLAETFVRDKDGVMAAALTADAVAAYKAQGRTLWDVLEGLWKRHGYYLEEVHSITFSDSREQKRAASLMRRLRRMGQPVFGLMPVAFTDDYQRGVGIDHQNGRTHTLPLVKSDVLHYRFADGGFVVIRPSGTEPKLKFYFSVVAPSETVAREKLARVKTDVLRAAGLRSDGY